MNLSRLTNFVLAHKRLVAAFWIALTFAGFFAAGRVGDSLQTQFSMPDSESAAANQEILRTFGSDGTAPPLVAVAELPPGGSASAVRADLRALDGRLAEAIPGARVASYGSTGDRAFLSGDGQTAYAVVHLPPGDGDRGPAGAVPALDGVRRAADPAGRTSGWRS